jgi:hypothetical protein
MRDCAPESSLPGVRDFDHPFPGVGIPGIREHSRCSLRGCKFAWGRRLQGGARTWIASGGDGLALSPAQRGGIHDPDLLDVSGASLRDEQEPCLLPGYLIDRCPCLHDPLSALAGTCRTACVSGGAFTGNRSSACVWRRTDKPIGWKIPDEQSTQGRELLSLSLVVHGSTSLQAPLPYQRRGLRTRQRNGTGGGRDNPDRRTRDLGMDAGDRLRRSPRGRDGPRIHSGFLIPQPCHWIPITGLLVEPRHLVQGAASDYSARRNSTIATASRTSPIPRTRSSSSGMGTVHDPHVTPGLKRWRTAAGTSRRANTARRMGSTA